MEMKVLKPVRLGGPPLVQIGGIIFLSLFIGGIYIPLYQENVAFRNLLFSTWWPWVLPCFPLMWLLWFIAESMIVLQAKHRMLQLLAFQFDKRNENIRITFKLIGVPQSQVTEKMLKAKYQPFYGGGLPSRFKYQQMIYDADEDLYEIIINTSGLLIEIKDIFIYVEQKKGIIPYHCIYLVHRFGGAKQSACLIFDKRQLK